ncbi:MAG TPA: AraC family transcriptional regulator [Puia sp.]|nr:AraC family transcriptional regulator [Puia sp.]
MDCPSQHVALEQELLLTIYNTIPKKVMTVKLNSHKHTKQEWYSLLYINAGNDFILTGSDEQNKSVIDNSRNLLVTFNNPRIDLHISTPKDSELVEINFSRSWLLHQYSNPSNRKPGTLFSLTNKSYAVGFMDKEDKDHVQKLIDSYHLGANIFRLKFITLSLVTNLMKKNIDSENQIMPAADHLPHEISELINKIKEHVSDHLPAIKELAKELSTSESTLQRHFKSIYGKSVYDYYLDLKMEKAKELLSQNETNVKHVAYLLGYDDVSSFINTFKKHTGSLPGDLKKNQSYDKEDA